MSAACIGISGQLFFLGECQPPTTLSAASAVGRSRTTDNNTNPQGSATVQIPYKVAVVDPNNSGRRYVSDPIIDNDPDVPGR